MACLFWMVCYFWIRSSAANVVSLEFLQRTQRQSTPRLTIVWHADTPPAARVRGTHCWHVASTKLKDTFDTKERFQICPRHFGPAPNLSSGDKGPAYAAVPTRGSGRTPRNPPLPVLPGPCAVPRIAQGTRGGGGGRGRWGQDLVAAGERLLAAGAALVAHVPRADLAVHQRALGDGRRPWARGGACGTGLGGRGGRGLRGRCFGGAAWEFTRTVPRFSWKNLRLGGGGGRLGGGAVAGGGGGSRGGQPLGGGRSRGGGGVAAGGGGWVGGGQGLAWSPTHGPPRLPCRTRLGGCTRVSGHKAYQTVDRPQTPRWRSRAGDAAVPVCMCPCVSGGGGGGGLWHTCLLHCCSAVAHMAQGSVCLVLQAPAGRLESLTLSPPGEMWAWARNLHVTRTYYPTTPRLPIGTGRRWYVARLGSDPHSLTALGTGGAASRAGSGSHGRGRTLGRWRGTRAQSVLPCPGCRQCWLHWLRRYSPA